MQMKSMTAEEFIEFLKQQQGKQTAKSFAASLGVSPQYLCDVYNGRKALSESITDGLSNVGVTVERVYRVTTTIKREEK